jgi:soluble lytic murein transglycosylase-like protein
MLVEIWKLRKDIGVIRASLADVLAQAEAARRAVDQVRWLLRDDEQALAAQREIETALERVNRAVGHLCDSATHLHEAAKSTTADLV